MFPSASIVSVCIYVCMLCIYVQMHVCVFIQEHMFTLCVCLSNLSVYVCVCRIINRILELALWNCSYLPVTHSKNEGHVLYWCMYLVYLVQSCKKLINQEVLLN